MFRRLLDLPLPVLLLALTGLAMFVPALHANIIGDFGVWRAFLYAGLFTLTLTGFVAIAVANHVPRDPVHSQFRALILAYILLPPVMTLPMFWAVPDTRIFNLWFEMVSSFTTTGATLYDIPGRLTPSIHLWRGLVGWFGGFFTLVTAIAILAPMNLGGFEVLAPRAIGRQVVSGGQITRLSDPSERLTHHAVVLFPAYALATLVLWLGMVMTGEDGLVALMHSMAVLSTSGITSQAGQSALSSGLLAEAMMAVGLVLALSRRTLPGLLRSDQRTPLAQDSELRMGFGLALGIPAVLGLYHWVGSIGQPAPEASLSALPALWGAFFTTLSFLTTTGFESQYWQETRLWSGISTPGMILLGLAIMGGGVATTAGGVKLLRVYALMRLGMREIDRLNYPSSVAGGGTLARKLRGEGAFMAFVFFMLFALTLGVSNLALAMAGIGFDRAVVLSVAALTTTGPLANAASDVTRGYADLSDAAKAILAVTMVLGRLEALALLAFILPTGWRR